MRRKPKQIAFVPADQNGGLLRQGRLNNDRGGGWRDDRTGIEPDEPTEREYLGVNQRDPRSHHKP
jgi:hypothetical protein